jgi:hypothetical protein
MNLIFFKPLLSAIEWKEREREKERRERRERRERGEREKTFILHNLIIYSIIYKTN